MEQRFSLMPRIPVKVFCESVKGEFQGWRHTIGHGGINNFPLPKKVRRGLKELRPRLVRTFIQEYFDIYPDHDTYDWSKLDPYMESLAESGGKIVACICVKPRVLFPIVDQNIFMPNNISEWQRLVEALVRRYSVENEFVTYWEIANEPDIGEYGGCPYLIENPEDYIEYYKITQEAVLRAFPKAKVGGPALANPRNPTIDKLIEYCAKSGTQLDFVSWHAYADDPEYHASNIYRIKAIITEYYPQNPPEMLITEYSKGFDDVCVEENAYSGFFPAAVAAIVFNMLDAKVDWTFYYHIWDQLFIADQFRSFYKDLDIMHKHWNKIPHRLGLFGVCCEVRPTYFFFRLLGMMEGDELSSESGAKDLRVKACKDGSSVSVMLVNYDTRAVRDVTAEVDFNDIGYGLKLLTTYRIDSNKNWDIETLRPIPVERRYVDVGQVETDKRFYCNVFCPAHSVTLVIIEDASLEQMTGEYEGTV